MKSRTDFAEKFNLKKIGAGAKFKVGDNLSRALEGTKSRFGQTLAGNLSKKDLATFHGLIGKRLKQLRPGAQLLPAYARREILLEADQLRRQGKISQADVRDLRQIVKKLSGLEHRVTTRSVNQPAVGRTNPSLETNLTSASLATDRRSCLQPATNRSQKLNPSQTGQQIRNDKPAKESKRPEKLQDLPDLDIG